MRNILLGIATSFFLIGCGGGKACEELISKVCEGDAACVKAMEEEMKADTKEVSKSDMNAACKEMLNSKELMESLKKDAKRKAGKKDGGDKKEEKKEEKKDDEKKE